MENKVINVWTDGGARSSTNVSGWAYVGYVDNDTENLVTNKQAMSNKTNQQMEMTAIIAALYSLPLEIIENHRVKVYTDSAYICNCFKDEWWKKWKLNNWKNSKKKDVANKELWEELIYFYDTFDVEYIKVKGHSNNQMNNLADKLVNEAMDEYEKGLDL